MDWFLYDNGPRHESVKHLNSFRLSPGQKEKLDLNFLFPHFFVVLQMVFCRPKIKIYVNFYFNIIPYRPKKS